MVKSQRSIAKAVSNYTGGTGFAGGDGELGCLCDKTDSNVSCACVVGSAQCSGCVVYIMALVLWQPFEYLLLHVFHACTYTNYCKINEWLSIPVVAFFYCYLPCCVCV